MKTKIEKMYKYFVKYIFTWALMLSVLLSGCMAFQVAPYVPPGIAPGEVLLLHPGSTWHGIMNSAKGAVGTARFAKDGYYLFTWVMKDQGAAFAIIQNSKAGIQNFMWGWGGKGQIVNSMDWNNMQKYLLNSGWKSVPASAIPLAFTAEIAAAGTALAVISAGLPNLLILPAGVFDKPLNLKPPSLLQ